MVFVIILVALYDKPIFQCMGCSVAASFNLIFLCFSNPFTSKAEYVRILIPEACIFGCLCFLTLFSINEFVPSKYKLDPIDPCRPELCYGVDGAKFHWSIFMHTDVDSCDFNREVLVDQNVHSFQLLQEITRKLNY
jgi:hypothetical protein